MDKKEVIRKVEKFVKKTMTHDPVHAWDHIDRVRKLALYLARKEKADKFIVELAALLHDVGDYKYFKGAENAGSKICRKLLGKLGVDRGIVNQVCEIVDEVTFKGARVKSKVRTVEGMVVRDADKLDNLGAIGIARTLTWGGLIKRTIHDPRIKPVMHATFEQYKKRGSTTINHFYEKVLLLKDQMHTSTARKLALRRHRFVEKFLKEFYKEWDGKL
ncbi:MAG: HD domain-containing protein [Candidatus Doudnabacteria bacterium]|nr:HD domain-containing protein [Candidatus Doudnabacteria bacterium]